jgi:hypothetical protein
MEKMDQIFSAFFTTKPQGSGMGLSISRSIVESHGGRLWAAANDGRGATFHFTLPTAAEILQVPATGRDLVFPGLPRGDTDRDQGKPTAKKVVLHHAQFGKYVPE